MRAFLSKISAATLGIIGLAAGTVDTSAQTTTLVGWTNLWAYNDTTTPTENLHGTAWQTPGYDTNSAPGWKTGPALFGNDGGGLYDGPGRPFSGGINGFLTPLNRGVAAAADRVTFYFRKSFTFSGSADSILEAKWVHDDGIVVYINGTEALRSKMQVAAPGLVEWSSLGQNHDSAAPGPVVVEGFEYTQDLDSSLLVQGENTIAVELHQSSTTSSDVAFAMQLSSIVPTAPVFISPNQPTNRTVLQNRSSVLTAEATSRPAPAYQWYMDGNPIDGAIASSLLVTNESADSITREYFCRVSNPLGSIDSRVAEVLYTSDSVPPVVVSVKQAGGFDTVTITFDEVIANASAVDAFNFDVTDGINLPLGVNSSVPSADGKSVILTLGSPMLENTLYTATIGASGLADVAGNIMPPVDVQFTSWISTSCGGVLFETFDTEGGSLTAITALTGHPNYPNNPRETYRLNSFSTREVYTDDSHENYGGRLRALFIPPTSGNWVFYLSSDDAGQVFFNPNGPGEGGKSLILNETSCCRVYTANTSTPFALEAGKAYYLEAIYKEGGGGDYLHVWAGPQGAVPPSAAAASLTPADAIPGSMLGSPAAPANAAGTFTITQQPANQTVTPNATATFTVGTSTDTLLCYQWLRNGEAIPGAIGQQYNLVASAADDGARFSVVISIIGGSPTTSAEATLTVGADTLRPTVVSVAANTAGTSLTVTYSEPMGPSAAIAANYTIGGVAASSATLTSPTVATVVPATPLPPGGCTLSEVRISGVTDVAASPNLINPNPTIVSLSSPLVDVLAFDAAWKYDDSGTDLGTAWRETAFNDSAWLSGAAPLGFEPATAQIPVIATPIAAGSTTNTTYFRTHFNLGVAPASVAVLQLSGVIDDGAVIYVNGVEAGRVRMPAAPAVIAASTLATGSGPEPTDGTHTVENITIAKTALVAGDNVLAVELHSSSLTSSDSEFAASVKIVLCLPTLVIEHVGSQVKLTWADAAYRLETAPEVTGPWTSRAGASGIQLPATPNNAFFRLAAP